MQTLLKDIIRYIFYLLDDVSLVNVCLVNKYFNEEICNDKFWIEKIRLKWDYLTVPEIRGYINNYHKGSPSKYYVFLTVTISGRHPNKVLEYGANNQYTDLILIASRMGANIHVDTVVRACINGNLEIVRLLVRLGADINSDGEPLRYAVSYGHLDIVDFLLKAGADIHIAEDSLMNTAGRFGNLEIMKLLLKYGADPKIDSNLTLLQASTYGHDSVVKLLIEHGADIHSNDDHALRAVVGRGNVELVRFLLENGANVHARNNQVLNLAKGNTEMLELLAFSATR